MVKTDAFSDVGRDVLEGDGHLPESSDDASHKSRKHETPAPSQSLESLSGDLSPDKTEDVASPQDLVGRLTECETAAKSFEAEIANLERIIMGKRTAQASEILQLEQTRAEMTREFEDTEA